MFCYHRHEFDYFSDFYVAYFSSSNSSRATDYECAETNYNQYRCRQKWHGTERCISITMERRDAPVDPAYNLKNRTKEIEAMYNALGPQYEPRLTKILGNLALVREMCGTCGEQTVTFAD